MQRIPKRSGWSMFIDTFNIIMLFRTVAGNKISWTSTEEGILLKIKKKVTEEDIIGLIKKELPYNSVEIKKRGSKGLKW